MRQKWHRTSVQNLLCNNLIMSVVKAQQISLLPALASHMFLHRPHCANQQTLLLVIKRRRILPSPSTSPSKCLPDVTPFYKTGTTLPCCTIALRRSLLPIYYFDIIFICSTDFRRQIFSILGPASAAIVIHCCTFLAVLT